MACLGELALRRDNALRALSRVARRGSGDLQWSARFSCAHDLAREWYKEREEYERRYGAFTEACKDT